MRADDADTVLTTYKSQGGENADPDKKIRAKNSDWSVGRR